MIESSVSINDYITTLKGFAFKSAWYTESGIPIVKVSDFTQDSVSPDKVSFIPIETSSDFEKYKLQKGDVLIQTVGSWEHNPNSVVGKVVKVPEILNDSLLNQNIVKIIPNDTIDKNFLYYLLKNDVFKGYILNTAQGAANQASITLESIRAFKFTYKNKTTQRKIASILSAYDDLIENNLKRIKLLEEQAFLKYKGVLTIEKLEQISVFDYAHIMSGGTPSTTNPNFWEGEIPFFTPKDLSSQSGYYLNDTERKLTELGLEKCNSKLFPRDTIFITARGTVGKLVLSKIPSAISQSNYAITTRNGSSNYFLFLALIDKVNHFKQLAVGGVFDTIIVDTFKMILIELPNKRIIDQFNIDIKPIFQLIDTLQKQNTKLREARDILLPKLMNGQIEV